jgi:hypothetical protein
MLGSNDAAAADYLGDPDAPAAALVAAAIRWRAGSPADAEEALALLRDGLQPLHLQLIDDLEDRVAGGDPDLASALRDWRARLVRSRDPD